MNILIQTNNNNNFTGLKNTSTLQRARKYAIDNGEGKLFNLMEKAVNSYSTDNLVISVRKNSRPKKCLHVTVANRRDDERLIYGTDYTIDGSKDMGEVAYGILKQLFSKESSLHKKMF